MRIFMIIIAICFGIMMPFNSYAQTQNNLVAFVQIKIQDSNGNLVSYLECTKMIINDMAKLNHLLDQNSPVFTKSFVTNGDQKFEIIKVNDTIVHTSATIVSKNIMSSTNDHHSEDLVMVDHDGYPVVKGDRDIVYWTFIRPVS